MDKMDKIISLCKRRGFIFQNSEIYGGLKSSYDYGPLGVEFKRNIADLWWREMVHGRDNIYGLDAAIIMHPKVWKTSGHLSNFSDPLVDCFDCKSRFRPDKLPQLASGTKIEYEKKQKGKKIKLEGNVGSAGVVCPNCGSPNLSEIRQFRGMFESVLGPVDPLNAAVNKFYSKGLSQEEFLKCIREQIDKDTVYLRPETAQAMFVQFLNVVQTTSAKVPFGIAQIGKSFRNEIVVEHFIFRSCEFEQMEMEFFCEPGTQTSWLKYWTDERMRWYKEIANHSDCFRLRSHGSDELAHYSDSCFDVEYKFPWGWDELEGVASRTDYDLDCHAKASGAKLSYFDPQAIDPKTGKKGWRYKPYVIEPAAGLTRLVLCLLLDAYTTQTYKDSDGKDKERTFLKLHPKLAPFKVAVLPLVKKDPMLTCAKTITRDLRSLGLNVICDHSASIGKRYAKHDEIGTPWCVTVDSQTEVDKKVTVRMRDTTEQIRLPVDQVVSWVTEQLTKAS